MGAGGEIAGYAVADDVSARDLQKREPRWVRAKGFDTSCPWGPWITTVDELPSATGLRIASAVSLILTVTAELVIGSAGLGRSINIARSGGNEELMYALILTTGILGVLLNGIFVRAERRVLRWHPSQRSGEAGA